MEPVALEADELRVDALAPERLNVCPWHAGRVDGAVNDSERPGYGCKSSGLPGTHHPVRCDTPQTQ